MSKPTSSLDIEKIRSLRASKQWTQEYVAEQLHISPTQYARIERGEISPRIEMLFKIAGLFEKDVWELLEVAQHFTQTQFAYSSPDATQAQQSNVYHNNYYGNDVMAAEMEKMRQTVQHTTEKLTQQDELLAQLKTAVRQKDEEIAFLRKMLQKSEKG